MKKTNRSTVTHLTDLPNIGEKMAHKLHLINIQHPQDLIGKNGYQLFDKLCRVTGKKYDPCVVDVLLSVADFMNGGEAKPWWKYTTERLALLPATFNTSTPYSSTKDVNSPTAS